VAINLISIVNPYSVIIIGGGPSGMMAAIAAAEVLGCDTVAIFEKNASLARKLGLTGKGRCNLTNICPLEEFLEKFGKNGVFLRNAFSRFFVQDLISFFEVRGLKMKTERQGRVFPTTDQSTSVIAVLKKALAEAGVETHLSSPVQTVEIAGVGMYRMTLASGKEIFSRKIIVAAGGSSYPETGSTGDGFKIASEFKHTITELEPGLVPLETEEQFVKELQGLTLKNIKIVFLVGSKEIESDTGELLFTHFGVSGPLILDLSAKVSGDLHEKRKVKMLIDLKPALSVEQLDLKLRHEFQTAGALKIKNYFTELLPKRLTDIFLKLTRIEGEKKCHQITASERKKIIEMLKKLPLTIKRTRPMSEAMVTCGGVSLKEIDPKTMESRKSEGVYFCGEVLDLAAASGGFNLQAAFSTGYVAGEAAALSVKI
jgi:predicted Rossmann fold flavoprotein